MTTPQHRSKPIDIALNGVEFHVVTPAQITEYRLKGKELWKLGSNAYLLVQGHNWDKLYQAAGYDTNKLDMAYPQQWRDQNKEVDARFRKGDFAAWYYGGKQKIFGEPIWRSEVQKRIIALAQKKVK